jgi:hypothetical protein
VIVAVRDRLIRQRLLLGEFPFGQGRCSSRSRIHSRARAFQ